MNNFISSNGIPLTEKDLECLAALEKMTDDDIDYSDIPKMTKEELKKFKPTRLRKKNWKIAG